MPYRFLPDRLLLDLMANSVLNSNSCREVAPVVKLFAPDGHGIWLLVKVLDNPKIAYGLIDIGQRNPSMGYVDLELLSTARGKMGLPIERDVDFVATYPLWVYHVASTLDGYYSEDDAIHSTVYGLKMKQPKIITPRPSMN